MPRSRPRPDHLSNAELAMIRGGTTYVLPDGTKINVGAAAVQTGKVGGI